MEVLCHCQGFHEAQQLIIRTTDEIVMHVPDRLLFVEVHLERDLEWGRVFIDGACDGISNEEKVKRLSTNGHFHPDADCSAISLVVFVRYVRCL